MGYRIPVSAQVVPPEHCPILCRYNNILSWESAGKRYPPIGANKKVITDFIDPSYIMVYANVPDNGGI